MSGQGGSGPSTAPAASVQEFKIRVPKNMKKKHHVMRFNATLNVDFAKWSQVKMERENNMKEYRGMDEDQPKFGAGSEFGRDAREEARRKKFGIIARRYRPDDQPWILKVGGKNGKKFKGLREGGVSENAAYYVFTHAPDGAIEAYPLQEWYNFQPIQRYKALSAEEAEQEFGRRNKALNYFSLMFRKRMRGDDADGDLDDPDDKKTKTGKGKTKELKISDMDEWMDSDDDSSDSDAEKDKDKDKDDSDSNSKKKKKGAAAAAAAKKKKKDVDDEAVEESDDGDEEGRERDYISDSSDSDSDHEGKANKELKSVAEEDALRKLLTSDEDSEEEKQAASSDEEKKEKAEKNEKAKNDKTEAAKKADSSSDLSSDSDNEKSSKPTKTATKRPASSSRNNSRSGTPTPSTASGSGAGPSGGKPPAPSAAASAIAAANAAANQPPSKKPRFDPSLASEGVTEQAVRRYLARKPMTTTELLTKFKQRKTGVSSDRLVETMTQILKKINPLKQTIKGKMYLSIKP